LCKAQIQLTPGSNANQLLSSVLTAVEIHSFRELVPSMNDIFIKKVSEQNSIGTQSNFTE
jgi:ABC-2 type transport system ATP-binding protein